MSTILITGAAGTLGQLLTAQLRNDYTLRLTDVQRPDGLFEQEDFRLVDITNADDIANAATGVDAIVHLGGISSETDFDSILAANIVGTRNVFEAARLAGVKRVVFPSSNQVIGFYERNRRLDTSATLRPSGWYGVSKAFGEAVGALYADKYGLRVFAIRIGRFAPLPEDRRGLSIWVGPEDLVQLVRIGLEHPDIHFEIVYGVSNNDRGWWDNKRAFDLGYRPQLNAETHLEHALEANKSRITNDIAERFSGGRLTSLNFAGDLSRTGR